MRAEISDYKQKNESNPPRIISLSKWRGKEVWHPWPVQTTSERQRRQMNCLWQCWAPLGSYKWLSMRLPLVVCVCMVFNECFTYQDSSITNEGRTVFCYCSHKPDTKLCILHWKLLNVDTKKGLVSRQCVLGSLWETLFSGENNNQ